MEHCRSPVPTELPAISDGRLVQITTAGANQKRSPTSDVRVNGDVQVVLTSSLIAAARRLGILEDRMVHQEATLRRLMERAFGIQQQIESIGSSAQTGLDHEQRERRLVQEHVQTVTNLVNQLHQQMTDLRQSLHNTDQHVQYQTRVLVQLESNHRHLVSDTHTSLHQNASMLSQLSTRLQVCEETVSKLRQRQESDRAEHMDAVQQLQQQVSAVQCRLQQLSKEQQTNMRHTESALKQAATLQEMNFRQQSDELKRAIAGVYSSCQDQHDNILSKTVHLCEETSASQRDHHKQLEEQIVKVTLGIRHLEDSLHRESHARSHLAQHLHEQHVSRVISQQQTLKQLEEKFEGSLEEVHKSLSSLQELINTKHALLLKQLEKELQHVLKTVVVV